MRKDRIKKAINVMLRVRDEEREFDMSEWQDAPPFERVKKTEQELVSCGTAACFAGWLAVSPEWQEDGGTLHTYDGSPVYGGLNGSAAIAKWFELDHFIDADIICGVNIYSDVESNPETPQDVIDLLMELLQEGALK